MGFFDRWKKRTTEPEQEESSFIKETEFPDGMVVQRKADPVVWDWKTMDRTDAKKDAESITGELSQQDQQTEKYKWVANVARNLHQQNKDIDFLGAYDSTREFIALCSFVAESKGLHFDYKKISPSDKQLIDYCRMSEEEREKLKQDYGYSTLEQQSNISK